MPRGASPQPGEIGALDEQDSPMFQGLFEIAGQMQQDALRFFTGALSLKENTPRHALKLAFSMMQQAAYMGRMLMPGQAHRMVWQELTNKLQAFDLFAHVDVVLALPKRADLSLRAALERAEALGSYRSVWAAEGLGHYYTALHWERQGTPRALLADERSAAPSRWLVPLHVGMGLALAERVLQSVSSSRPEADIGPALEQFVGLCRQNARPGYTGAALEALGLVTRLAHPHLAPLIDQWCAVAGPEMQGYFWHGVGRALYFLPAYAPPYAQALWGMFASARREAPHDLARRNMIAGLMWAAALVNIRHPEIVAALIQRDDDVWRADGAGVNGMSAALLIWRDMVPGDPYLHAFCHYQPAANDPRASRWSDLARAACEQARRCYDAMAQTRQPLGEVFRYSH